MIDETESFTKEDGKTSAFYILFYKIEAGQKGL